MIATYLGHGFNLYLIFRNAIMAILLFGFLGYIWGIIYERVMQDPLIESYRLEAKERIDKLKTMGDQASTTSIPVDELVPGMIAAEEVYNQDGALLVGEGSVLTERSIQTLREHRIPSVSIAAKLSETTD